MDTGSLGSAAVPAAQRREPRVYQEMQGYSKAELEPPESAEMWIMVLERLWNVWRLEQFPETKKGRHGRRERKLSQDLTGSFQSSKKREIPPEYPGSSFHLRDDQHRNKLPRGVVNIHPGRISTGQNPWQSALAGPYCRNHWTSLLA